VAKDRFFAVLAPLEQLAVVASFWSTPGSGISSRFAEANLTELDKLAQTQVSQDNTVRPNFESTTHEKLRRRIAQHIARAPISHDPATLPAAHDVYLYPTGMGSIYKPHSYLLKSEPGTTVLFGMAFMNTLTAFTDFGPGHKFFGLGAENDIQDLEDFLQEERKHGRKVQAIWAEFPANPILVTPDLSRLRMLADEYDIVLAIDDTIGSWANIDLIGMVDLMVTSLTKSFNGYADAIAGSAVLNSTSRKYNQLKTLFERDYVPELYIDDAEALEANSRDYLARTTKLNHNASSIVQYLTLCAEDPNSVVRQVYYPSVNPSGIHYREFMRPTTTDFTPGYGCLMSIEFEDLPSTIAFYNNLNVHLGPHLGAPFTLAFAYTMCAYKNRLDWAAGYGLKPTQIRISAGLEDTDILLEEFRIAVEAANKTRNTDH
jgi:cystathionine gamma-synthase